MATPAASADEHASSPRDSVVATLQRARTVFRIGACISVRLGIALAMVLAMLVGDAGEPASTPQAPTFAACGGQSQLPSRDDHATRGSRGPLGGRELVAEAESRDELEERVDAPPAGVLPRPTRELVALDGAILGSSRRVAGSQLMRSTGLGRGPPARV